MTGAEASVLQYGALGLLAIVLVAAIAFLRENARREADRRAKEQERQAQRRQRVGVDQRSGVGLPALSKRLDEDRDQRHQQEHGEKGERGAQDQPLHQRRLAGGRARLEARLAEVGPRAQAECGRGGHVSGPSRYEVWELRRSTPAGR